MQKKMCGRLIIIICMAVIMCSCQKTIITDTSKKPDIPANAYIPGDTITYEVLTSDPGGWFGVWNAPNGQLTGTDLDSVTFGSPKYLPSGWRNSFVAISGVQAFMSIASKTYSNDISINLYRNNQLLISNANQPFKGVSRLMVDAGSEIPVGTAENPVLTYEVTVSEVDSSISSNAWLGDWADANGVINNAINPILGNTMPMPNGWHYSFVPDRLPFTMNMQAYPTVKDGATVTTRFYKNNVLVKSGSFRDLPYPPLTYEVK